MYSDDFRYVLGSFCVQALKDPRTYVAVIKNHEWDVDRALNYQNPIKKLYTGLRIYLS